MRGKSNQQICKKKRALDQLYGKYYGVKPAGVRFGGLDHKVWERLGSYISVLQMMDMR